MQAQNRLLLVDQAEICYAAIDEGVIRVVTQNSRASRSAGPWRNCWNCSIPTVFWRAHRGFVVNINHIREVVPWFKSSYQLRMNDKKQTEIPVSRGADQAAARVVQSLKAMSRIGYSLVNHGRVGRHPTQPAHARLPIKHRAAKGDRHRASTRHLITSPGAPWLHHARPSTFLPGW